jgi:plastocyanin
MRLVRSIAIPLFLSLPVLLNAQSLLDRPPNLSGNWVGAPGSLYFHFVHRFMVGEAPARKVINSPTLLLAAGLPRRLLLGLDYSTNSTLSSRFPNELEYFARWAPVSENYGAQLDIGGELAYNTSARGVDGELSIGKKLGPARVILAGRALSDPVDQGNVRFAAAGGATVRLGQYVALAGDVASLTDRTSSERIAWSAGIHLAIPLTPHTFSLQATNTEVTTLQGASRGQTRVRYGFEFTIPLTLRRYFGTGGTSSSPDTAASVSAAMVDSAAPGQKAAEAVVPGPVTELSGSQAQGAVSLDSAAIARPDTARQSVMPAAPAPSGSVPVAPSNAKLPASRVRRTVIKNISYMQPRLQVAVGTTVEWVNDDPLEHSVTAADGSFNSGLIRPGKSWRHTFTRQGTYRFSCIPHPFMKGVIVVSER